MPLYYRLIAGETGIFQAVDEACPEDDPRRSERPRVYWLPRVGHHFPGATSYWTRLGLQKYVESGLFSWHNSVLTRDVSALTAEGSPTPHYADPYQILCRPAELEVLANDSLADFLKQLMKILD